MGILMPTSWANLMIQISPGLLCIKFRHRSNSFFFKLFHLEDCFVLDNCNNYAWDNPFGFMMTQKKQFILGYKNCHQWIVWSRQFPSHGKFYKFNILWRKCNYMINIFIHIVSSASEISLVETQAYILMGKASSIRFCFDFDLYLYRFCLHIPFLKQLWNEFGTRFSNIQ